MTCPSCGAENPAGKRFCSKCGTRLALACPNCGAPLEGDERFCGDCGAPIAITGSPGASPLLTSPSGIASTAPHAPAAERRVVSVLFADLVGFTTLSEARDAEEVRELLTRYFDASRRIIARYGGTVEKFIGDAVMAVWGTPVAQEDDAERAVRAAIDLVGAVAELGQDVGAPELRARAGVATGEAAVTIGAEGQGMVAGDLVNTASRIQSAAQPGLVYVGAPTRRASEAAIVFEEAGTHELKGKAEPIPLWRAVRVVAARGGAQRSAGLEAPFIGRDRELRLVKDLFHDASQEGKAHLVSIVGIAGIGKSRLSWEFEKYIDGLSETVWWHRGRCLAYGEGVAYWALAEMVRMRAGIVEGEEPRSARSKLLSTTKGFVTDPEELKWVEPALSHLLSLEEDAPRGREDLFAAWRLFFERLAERQPTVLLFEDMQWADASLLDFVEYLLEWSRNHPLYVLTLARPEIMDRRPTWGAGKRNFTSMYLEPLPREAMEELLSGLVPGLPDELRWSILERSEGVPLYAVETVRMLLDRGLLVQEGAAYRPSGPIGALEVPESLHGLIAARLDGLPPEERRLIQDASVLGKTFTPSALASLSGLPEEQLEGLLTSLVRKEVLSLQSDPRSPERGQYGFLQDLLRTVAFDTLSKRDRKAKHLAVASYLEAAWGAEEAEIVEVVASHFLEAYRAAPEASDAGEIKANARGMLARAGERAASLAASDEAQRYFEQAAELADERLVQAELLEQAGKMAWKGGRAEAATGHFEQAISTFESIGLTHPAARVSAALAEIVWQQGRIEEAVDRMEAAFAVLAEEEADADLAMLAAQIARLLYFSGRQDVSFERVEFALQVAEVLRLPEVLSQALTTKALIMEARNRPEEGLALLRYALQTALEHDLSSAALRAYINLIATMGDYDRDQEGMELRAEALELAHRVGDRVQEYRLLAGQTGALFALGRWDEALGVAEQLRGAPEFVGMPALDLLLMAVLHTRRGELEEARRVLAIAPDAERSRDVQTRAFYNMVRGPLLMAEGRFTEALSAGEEAYRARGEMGMRQGAVKEGLVEALEAAFALGDQAKVEEYLGAIEALRPGELTPSIQAQGARFGARLAALRGETDRVEPGFMAAAGLFRDIGLAFPLGVTLLEHGEWLVAQSRPEEAEPLLSESRKIFEGLKARPWLERLEQVRARRPAVTV